VDRGHALQRVKSELTLTDEALAEAEPVLTVAIGLGIPGRRT